jgi:hypothetical protein
MTTEKQVGMQHIPYTTPLARTEWEWFDWGGKNRKLSVIGREVWNSIFYWSIN